MHYQPSGCQMIVKNLILFINLTPFVPLPFYCGVRKVKLPLSSALFRRIWTISSKIQKPIML